jgi:putative N6-adenine-specific DNA methylase
LSAEQSIECVATCRPGLEGVLTAEVAALGGASVRAGKRAVYFSTDRAGLYRMNMALRTAIQVLVPIRTFNARDYKWLYHQARRTNWHQLFTPDKSLRIDVNGQSRTMRNTQYVVHRVKDGIVDTFRKMAGGIRPSIDKAEPEIHVVVHLGGDRATLCLDSSGAPLFKRGYRLAHGVAPIKEDLAAGILLLGGAPAYAGLLDPMCGSGTFLFEGWMLWNGVAPNLDRSFACQHWLDYDPELFAAEQARLREAAAARSAGPLPFIGCDSDAEVIRLAEAIRLEHFPEADIGFRQAAIADARDAVPGGLMVINPPYGKRLGEEDALPALYREIGEAARRLVPGGRLALFTANRKAARQVRLTPERTLTLFNGALEGLLYQYPIHAADT